MEQTILNEEKTHLKKVSQKLIKAKEELEKSIGSVGSTDLERLQEIRENGEASDFAFLLEQIHEKDLAFNFKDKFKRFDELKASLEEPYFSRIDLVDQNLGTHESYYIGKFGYTEDKPVITDWRAKISSVYYRYRYPQKNVTYETPGGPETKDLALKRTFEIERGELVKFYNNDIQFDESSIISEKISKRSGGVLEDIVETIQKSQLDIIEADPRQICVVQGCVGSGKSTVAIHKLSHIFFNFPKIIHPERSILIAKNQILVGYLSTLFPKLGIFDVIYKTLRDVVINIIFREEIKIEVDMDKNTDISAFDTKYKDTLDKKVAGLHQEFGIKINDVFGDPEFQYFGGYKYQKNISIYENISEIMKDLGEELDMQSQQLKENPNSVRAWLYKENIRALRKILTKLRTLGRELIDKKLPSLAIETGLNTSDKLGYFGTLVYIYLYSEVVGLVKTAQYEYCVVDEGQDFGLLEYAILNKIVLRGRFSIFGDLNQAITENGITSWQEISAAIVEAKKANVFELDTNYRSTKQIIALASNIISPYTKNYLPKSIKRVGNEPELKRFATEGEVYRDFAEKIKKDATKLNKSIGVICMDSGCYERVAGTLDTLGLEEGKLIKLAEKSKAHYSPASLYLMNFESCKGLEFSKVYIIGLDLKKIRDFSAAKRAFVAVTRAMNELVVYSSDS